jgi:hypothetical protein
MYLLLPICGLSQSSNSEGIQEGNLKISSMAYNIYVVVLQKDEN